jgi:hypothetical protein
MAHHGAGDLAGDAPPGATARTVQQSLVQTSGPLLHGSVVMANLRKLSGTVELMAKNCGKPPQLDEVLAAARALGWKTDPAPEHDELVRDMAEITGRLQLRWNGGGDEVLAKVDFTIYVAEGSEWIWSTKSAAGVFSGLYENGLRLRSAVIKHLVQVELEKGVGEPDRVRRLAVS